MFYCYAGCCFDVVMRFVAPFTSFDECSRQRLRLKTVKTRKTNRSGRLSTIDLLIRVACFVKKVKIFKILKAADLNIVLGGQALQTS